MQARLIGTSGAVVSNTWRNTACPSIKDGIKDNFLDKGSRSGLQKPIEGNTHIVRPHKTKRGSTTEISRRYLCCHFGENTES